MILNPIIDWEDEDVWEFILNENLPYCSLYDDGYTRLGCIGCPMNSHAYEELDRWPKYKEMYLMTYDRMLKTREELGLTTEQWTDAQSVLDWQFRTKCKNASDSLTAEYKTLFDDFNNPYHKEE